VKALARAADCTLNDIVLYLCGTALRSYLSEHARLPSRSLTAGIPVSLREADDNRPGTAIGMIVAELGTNVGDPRERLEAAMRSMSSRGSCHSSGEQARRSAQPSTAPARPRTARRPRRPRRARRWGTEPPARRRRRASSPPPIACDAVGGKEMRWLSARPC